MMQHIKVLLLADCEDDVINRKRRKTEGENRWH